MTMRQTELHAIRQSTRYEVGHRGDARGLDTRPVTFNACDTVICDRLLQTALKTTLSRN